jgi:hypothetical protein
MAALPRLLARLRGWLGRHETRLWWLHSAWALAAGVGTMWLGRRHFGLLRLAFAYIAFIWASSLLLPLLQAHPRLSARGRAWITLAINYFNKNFYQQLLFFLLPVYAASVTWSSANAVFVALVALSALVSTLDVVYDRHVAARRFLAALFFAFSLFVCLNVMLPVLWRVSNHQAMRLAGVLAVVGFATLGYRWRTLLTRRVALTVAAIAAAIAAFVEWGRPIVPPAPLRLVSVEFGRGVARHPPLAVGRLDALPPAEPVRVYAVSAIYAPLGLRDRVRHRWFAAGRELYTSPPYTVTGGRETGYRLWTYVTVRGLAPGSWLRLDVETEAGQLIGRAWLPVVRTPATTAGGLPAGSHRGARLAAATASAARERRQDPAAAHARGPCHASG